MKPKLDSYNTSDPADLQPRDFKSSYTHMIYRQVINIARNAN